MEPVRFDTRKMPRHDLIRAPSKCVAITCFSFRYECFPAIALVYLIVDQTKVVVVD